MKWTKNNSIKLSLACVIIFAAMMLAGDVFAYKWVSWLAGFHIDDANFTIKFMIVVYTSSVFGWICLYAMWQLLTNLLRGEVFTTANIKCMRIISWCCAGAAVIFAFGGLFYLPLFVVAIAAAFMMLIVRIVKNAFQQAGEMKSELDLTI